MGGVFTYCLNYREEINSTCILNNKLTFTTNTYYINKSFSKDFEYLE